MNSPPDSQPDIPDPTPQDFDDLPPNHYGKLAIIAMVVIAIAMGAVAWWVNYTYSDHLRGVWGPQTLRMIQDADTAELLFLEPWEETDGEQAAAIEAPDARLKIVETKDIAGAPGWLHARHALIEDIGYNFDQQAQEPEWTYALRFAEENQPPVELLLDLEHGYVREQRTGVTLVMTAEGQGKFTKFFAKRVARAETADRAPPDSTE